MKRQNLTKEQVEEIIRLKKEGMKQCKIAELIGTAESNVSRIVRQYREQSEPTPDVWSKPLNQCHPREIFDYLKSIGYSGDLIYSKKVTI